MSDLLSVRSPCPHGRYDAHDVGSEPPDYYNVCGGGRPLTTDDLLALGERVDWCVDHHSKGKQLEKAFVSRAGPSVAATANEENWRLPVRLEVKAGGPAKTVDTFYRNTKSQSDLSKAIGDIRSFVAIAMVDGSTDGLAVLRLSDLERLLEEARR